MISIAATRLIEPPPHVSSREWLPQNVTMPKGTETSGMPFSLSAFPHVDGVLEAFDDPSIRRVALQWGTRLGKTTVCLSLASKVAGTNPRNMMFASSTKESAGRVVSSRLYPILDATKSVSEQLPIESRRSKLDVRLRDCRIYVGWSGSETSLADVGAWFGVANEIDKWDGSASDEADSLKLFINRFKGFPDHKIIFESTPTIKGRSRIEKLMQESNQHRRYVPCPHCGEFQVLRKGDGESPGGFRWKKPKSGKSDPDVAFATAQYECEKCKGRIENHHRTQMLRDGVWVPDGCTIDTEGKIHGRAYNHGSDSVGFGPLPSWYALTETWGSFPRAWIAAQKRPRDLQDVINSYMAETWNPRPTKSTPERVAERLAGVCPRGIVPDGALFLTCTVDRQAAEGGFVKWVILAHGSTEESWLVDYGFGSTLEEIWEPVVRRQYQRQNSGPAMTPVLNAIDSGWNTKDTYDFCNTHQAVFACKGSSGDMSGKPYRLAEVESGEHVGQMLFMVNTDFWETELQARLDERLPGEVGSLTLCTDAARDLLFLGEMCNAMLTDKVDTRGNAKLLWIKKEESEPNDFRDAVRYGLALANLIVASGGVPQEVSHRPVVDDNSSGGFVRQASQRGTGSWIRRRLD